jgi:hypothetical protein
LLSEAENLCRNASMMIKVCAHTFESSHHFSSKFGIGFKIDISSSDENDQLEDHCSSFLNAKCSIIHSKATIDRS